MTAEEEKDISAAKGVTVKWVVVDVPPPGGGLVTVIDTVPLLVRFVSGTIAVSTVLSAYVVDKGEPFQFTTDASVNP